MSGVKPFAEQGHYTSVHDAIFDVVMPMCPPNAFKVLCFVIRKTRGWKKESDDIPYTQIQQGAGIVSKATVSSALKWLLNEGLIVRSGSSNKDEKGRQKVLRYALNRHYELKDEEETGSIFEPNPSTEIEPGFGTETVLDPSTEIEPFNNHKVPQEPQSKNQSTSGKDSPNGSSFPAPNQEFEEYPAKAMTTMTVDRCREVGFDPARHQIANWAKGWSRFVYVEGDEDREPPDSEKQFAVLHDIVDAAAGGPERPRFFRSVEDAVKRVKNGGGRDVRHRGKGRGNGRPPGNPWKLTNVSPEDYEGDPFAPHGGYPARSPASRGESQ